MESRVALIGIIVENTDSVTRLNAPQEVISALSGKIGMLSGVNSKVIYPKSSLN